MGHNQKIDSTLDMNFCSIGKKNQQHQSLLVHLSKSSIYLNSTTFMEHLNVYFIVPKFGLFLFSSRHKLAYTIVNSYAYSYEVESLIWNRVDALFKRKNRKSYGHEC